MHRIHQAGKFHDLIPLQRFDLSLNCKLYHVDSTNQESHRVYGLKPLKTIYA